MSEVRTDEQVVTDLDEWLDDDDTLHIVCGWCHIGPLTRGTLAVAKCGVLYRLRIGYSFGHRSPNDCEACRASDHRCPE